MISAPAEGAEAAAGEEEEEEEEEKAYMKNIAPFVCGA